LLLDSNPTRDAADKVRRSSNKVRGSLCWYDKKYEPALRHHRKVRRAITLGALGLNPPTWVGRVGGARVEVVVLGAVGTGRDEEQEARRRREYCTKSNECTLRSQRG